MLSCILLVVACPIFLLLLMGQLLAHLEMVELLLKETLVVTHVTLEVLISQGPVEVMGCGIVLNLSVYVRKFEVLLNVNLTMDKSFHCCQACLTYQIHCPKSRRKANAQNT